MTFPLNERPIQPRISELLHKYEKEFNSFWQELSDEDRKLLQIIFLNSTNTYNSSVRVDVKNTIKARSETKFSQDGAGKLKFLSNVVNDFTTYFMAELRSTDPTLFERFKHLTTPTRTRVIQELNKNILE